MKSYLTLFFLLATAFVNIAAQNPESFSRDKMEDDYDQFIRIVSEYNPQIGFRAIETGYNALDFLIQRKKELENITEYEDFIGFLKSSVACLQDIHSNMLESDELLTKHYDYFSERLLTSFDSLLYRNAVQGYIDYWRKNAVFYSFGNYLKYSNGKYYTQGNISFSNDKGDVISVRNCVLSKVNGLSPDSFLLNNPRCLLEPLRWDVTQKQYYTLSFPVVSSIITFHSLKNNKEITIDLSKYSEVSLTHGSKLSCQPTIPAVSYSKYSKVLYISIPDMRHSYSNIIDAVKEFKHCKIESIIIDLRDNRGGSDLYWSKLIQYLMRDTIKMPCKIAYKKKMIEYMADTNSNLSYDSQLDLYIQDLQWNHFYPEYDNLGFKGSVYVLQNSFTYSAAHSLSSICNLSDSWTSMGVPTGYLSGRGCGPYYFQLTNSGFTFSMECDVDLSFGFQNLFYHSDIPEVTLNPKTLKKLQRSKDRIAKKNYLRTHFLRYSHQ